jgi:hypothetical protein
MLRERGYTPMMDVAWAAVAQGDVRTLAWMLDSGGARPETAVRNALMNCGHPASLRGVVFTCQQVDLWYQYFSLFDGKAHRLEVTAWLSEAATDLDRDSWLKLLVYAMASGGPLPLLRRLLARYCGPAVSMTSAVMGGCSLEAADCTAAHDVQQAGSIMWSRQLQVSGTCQARARSRHWSPS